MTEAGFDLGKFAEGDRPWVWDVSALGGGLFADGSKGSPENGSEVPEVGAPGRTVPPGEVCRYEPSSIKVRRFLKPTPRSHLALSINHTIPGRISFGSLLMWDLPSRA